MITDTIISNCKKLITEADAILIGAGAGLSTAAGLEYSGKRFTDNFPDFIEKYGLTDMYSSAFYPWPTFEEKWAYFSRHILLNSHDAPPFPLYAQLKELIAQKDYFIITTNADGQFFKAGFDNNKIFAPQGDYRLFQCEKACHNTLYDNENMVRNMVVQQQDFKIPSELLPVCPVCGGNLVPHLRIDGFFVENEDWHAASKRYADFVDTSKGKKLLLLEFGVGFNTPGIIRFPFEQIALNYTNSQLVRVNKDNVQGYYKIPNESLLIKGDIEIFIASLIN